MAGLESRMLPRSREARRAERLALTFSASLRERGATKFSVDIRDLSVTGFRCETSFTLKVGARVWLTMPGLGGQDATVMWRDGYQYGFAFDSSLHPAVLDHIAERQRKRQAALERQQRTRKLSALS